MGSTTGTFRGLVVTRRKDEMLVCSYQGREVAEISVDEIRREKLMIAIRARADVLIRRVKSLSDPIEFEERKASGNGVFCLRMRTGESVHFKVGDGDPFYVGLGEIRSGKAQLVCHGSPDVHFRRWELDAHHR